ncbi:MAG: hypothetical protein ACOVSW_00075 [Candidatus Kapaibacteriota bacterium]
MIYKGNSIITFTAYVKPGEPLPEEIVLTDDNPMYNENSFKEKPETELVEELFGVQFQSIHPLLQPKESVSKYYHLLTRQLNLAENSWSVLNRINPDFTHGSKLPGDFDILICEPDKFDKTVAIEVKAIREQEGRPKRLSKLKHACEQAEGLLAMGFHQVYLAVVVEFYGREDTVSQNTLTRQSHRELAYLENIEEFLQQFRLSNSIGVLVIGIVQLGGLDYKNMGRVTIDKIRQAESRISQSERATEIVKGFVSE